MAIAIRSETSGSANGASSVVSVAKPSSVSNDDWLVVFLGVGDDLTAAAPPSDWISQQHGTSTGNDRQMLIAYKKVTNAAGEPSTYSFAVETADNAAWWIGSLSGVDLSASPVDVMGTWADLSNDLTPAAPSVTTTSASTLVFAAWASNYISAATMPAGWNTRINNKINTTVGLNVASRTALDSGSATGDVEITTAQTGMETTCVQIAFKQYVPAYTLTTACPINLLTSASVALTAYMPNYKLVSGCPINLLNSDNATLTANNPNYTLVTGCPINLLSSDNTTLTANIPNYTLINGCPINLLSSDNATLTASVPNYTLTTGCPINLITSDNISLGSSTGVVVQRWMLTMSGL